MFAVLGILIVSLAYQVRKNQILVDITKVTIATTSGTIKLYQFHKVALHITPPNPPLVRGGYDFIHSKSLEKWY